MKIKQKDLRVFSYIWAGIFTMIALYPLFDGNNIRLWAILSAVFFVFVGFFKPEVLIGFYRVWVKFGEFMGGIISKVILFILFYLMFTPIAIVLKLLRKDLLKKKIDKSCDSYWINREKQPETMKHQF